jgi:PadR family transcriptional regulator, regulatory protein PadR
MGAQETRELLPGTLDMLILKVLSRGEMHGYSIVSAIQRASDDVLGVVEGALYPALHRLEVRGWVRSKWGASDNNRRAKYYELTRSGRNQLQREADAWRTLTTAVSLVLDMG